MTKRILKHHTFQEGPLYLLLFSLYWAQGLPVGFMTHALPVILRSEGVSLAQIGGFGLLMLPWSIKILWAPLVDRCGSSQLGHYRSWIIPTQLMTVFILIGLSFSPISSLNQPFYLFIFFITLLFMNVMGATQDIATDALAVNMLKTEQQHWGNTFQVIGSRLGFIVGGGAILWALDGLSWQSTFLVLATLVLLNTLPIIFFKEPVQNIQVVQQVAFQPRNILHTLRQYLVYFTAQPERMAWLWVLITFKVADGISGPLLKPLMVDLGLSFTQIGVFITIVGASAALVGAGIAGFSLKVLSRPHAILIFSFIKLMSLAAYVWLAWQFETSNLVEPWVIYSINMLEDMVSAMLLVVLLTFIMHYSRKESAGTDFTFQVAILATVSGGLYSISGVLGDDFGYLKTLFFALFMAFLCIIPLFRWMVWFKNEL